MSQQQSDCGRTPEGHAFFDPPSNHEQLADSDRHQPSESGRLLSFTVSSIRGETRL